MKHNTKLNPIGNFFTQKLKKYQLTTTSDGYLWGYATIITFIVILALILSTYRSYGISMDESWDQFHSYNVIEWYRTLGKNRDACKTGDLFNYGSFVHILTGLAQRIQPETPNPDAVYYGTKYYKSVYALRKLICASFGFLAMIAVVKLTFYLTRSWQTSFFALLLIFINPVFLGHSFINTKDIPFASMYIWSIYYLVRIINELPTPSISLTLKCALAFGLTMAVRIGGVLLYFYMALFLLSGLYLLLKDKNINLSQATRQFIKSGLIISLCSYLIMIALWPWAFEKPLLNPFKALTTFSSFPWEGAVKFEGELIKATALPRHYLPKLLLIQNTEFLILGFTFFLIYIFVTLQKKTVPLLKKTTILLIAFTTFFPIAYAVIKQPVMYDNYRHFLFIIPGLCILSALGIDWLISQSQKLGKITHIAVYSLFACSILQVTLVSINLFPCQYAYYNNMVGGPGKAYQRYEADYWVASMEEALDTLNDRLDVYPQGQRFKVNGRNHDWPIFMRSRVSNRIVVTQSEADTDFFISMTRFDRHKDMKGVFYCSTGRYEHPYFIVHDFRPHRLLDQLDLTHQSICLYEGNFRYKKRSLPIPDQLKFRTLISIPIDINTSTNIQTDVAIRFSPKVPVAVIAIPTESERRHFQKDSQWQAFNGNLLNEMGERWFTKVKPGELFKCRQNALFIILASNDNDPTFNETQSLE